MRYLGNKTKLLLKIEKFIDDNKINGESFFDIFSGTGTVANYFKNRYKVSSNDFMTFSYIMQSSKLLNEKVPSFRDLNKYLGMDVFEFINSNEIDKIDKGASGFISQNYSDKSSDRMYFSKENGILIDKFRLLIEEWNENGLITPNERFYLLHSLIEASSKVSNTTGTYGAFLKKLDTRAAKRIFFDKPEITSGFGVATFNENSEELIRNIEGDILYIDPPYTNFNYSRGYHLLETIARYDSPKIKGITGVRENSNSSNFSRKLNALDSFENLIRHANFEHIIISYSNHGIITEEKLLEMLSKYTAQKPIIEYIDYREYKTINSANKPSLKEFLIYIKKDKKIIKSPLNYEGNKFKIVDEIIRNFPNKVKRFFDVFGGSGTVSFNVCGVDEIYYNDINTNTYSIVNWLINSNEKEVLKKIESEIKNNKLVKKDKEAFYEYRDKININKKPWELITLSYYSFQNMLRQNSSGEINIPAGLSEFNSSSKKNVRDLYGRMGRLKIKTKNLPFDEFINGIISDGISEDDLFYFDPPYHITTASYNDGKRGFEGWTLFHENLLLSKLKEIDEKGGKFMLSNVVNHKGETNHPLKEFIETHGYIVIELKDKNRQEVIVKNF